jgi:hypothetical protein
VKWNWQIWMQMQQFCYIVCCWCRQAHLLCKINYWFSEVVSNLAPVLSLFPHLACGFYIPF